MEKKWYILQVYSGFEKKIKDRIFEQAKIKGVDKFFDEVFIPTEEVVEIKNNAKKRSERKFFPGYILIKMYMNDENWHMVSSLPQTVGFLGGQANKITPIPDSEVKSILNKVQEGVEKPKPKVLYQVGEVVLVTEGPFKDFSGIVDQVDYEKSRMKIEVQILGRSTPVELDFSQVSKG